MSNKKLYLITTCIGLIVFSLTTMAQKTSLDVIHMKNGSVIKGMVVRYDTIHGIEVKTTDNYTWVVNLDDVAKIERKSYNYQLLNDDTELVPNGFINYTSMGILAGNGNNQRNAPFSILMSNGLLLNNRYSFALGTGIEFFSETYLPVFTDIRYNLTKRKVSPFLAFQGGYSFALDDDANHYDYYNMTERPLGGYLINAETGLTIHFRNYSALYFSAGYRHQLLRYKERSYDKSFLNQYLNRLSIRMGFIFQ